MIAGLAGAAQAGLQTQKQAGFGALLDKHIKTLKPVNADLGCRPQNQTFTVQQVIQMLELVIRLSQSYPDLIENYQHDIEAIKETFQLTDRMVPGPNYIEEIRILFPTEDDVDSDGVYGHIVRTYLERNCSNLTFAEFYAVYIYTQFGFEQINNLPNPQTQYKEIPFIRKNLLSAWNKLPVIKGPVYMGSFLDAARLKEISQTGILEYGQTYTSASATDGYTGFVKNAVILLKSKTGRSLEAVSSVKEEDEILFKPGLKMKVKKITFDPEAKSPEQKDGKVFQGIYYIEAEEI